MQGHSLALLDTVLCLVACWLSRAGAHGKDGIDQKKAHINIIQFQSKVLDVIVAPYKIEVTDSNAFRKSMNALIS